MDSFDKIIEELEMMFSDALGSPASGSSHAGDGTLQHVVIKVPDHDGDQRARLGQSGQPVDAFSSTLIRHDQFANAMTHPREKERSLGFGDDTHAKTLAFFEIKKSDLEALAQKVSAKGFELGIDGKEIRMHAMLAGRGGDPAPFRTLRAICVFVKDSHEFSLSRMVYSHEGMVWIEDKIEPTVVKPMRHVQPNGNPSMFAPELFVYVNGEAHLDKYTTAELMFPNHDVLFHPLGPKTHVKMLHYRVYPRSMISVPLERNGKVVANVQLSAAIYAVLGDFLTWAFRNVSAARCARTPTGPLGTILDVANRQGDFRDLQLGLVFAIIERVATVNLTEGPDLVALHTERRKSDSLYQDAANQMLLLAMRVMTVGLASAVVARAWARQDAIFYPLFVDHIDRDDVYNVELVDGERPSVRALLMQRGNAQGPWAIPDGANRTDHLVFSPSVNSKHYIRSPEVETLKSLRVEADKVTKQAAVLNGQKESLRRQIEALEAQAKAAERAAQPVAPAPVQSTDDAEYQAFLRWRKLNETHQLKIKANNDDDGDEIGQPRGRNQRLKPRGALRVQAIKRASRGRK